MGLFGNNGLIQVTNGFLATDFNGERIFVTVDQAVQGYCIRYPRLRLVRRVGIKERNINTFLRYEKKPRGMPRDLPRGSGPA